MVNKVLLNSSGFIFGYSILFSGAIPIKVIFFLKQNFSIPVCSPLSKIIALVFKAALLIPANNLTFLFVFAPIKTITCCGSINLKWSAISDTLKFLLNGSLTRHRLLNHEN